MLKGEENKERKEEDKKSKLGKGNEREILIDGWRERERENMLAAVAVILAAVGIHCGLPLDRS